MPRITLDTYIKAPIERVFDLSRSIDLHIISTKHTNEQAIDGKTTGLIELGEFVTWKAKHFGTYHILSSRITKFNRPHSFTDQMVKGAFQSFTHNHMFERKSQGTIMKDIFDYKSPYGIFGTLADLLFVKRYVTKLLLKRNETIKAYSESDLWQTAIP